MDESRFHINGIYPVGGVNTYFEFTPDGKVFASTDNVTYIRIDGNPAYKLIYDYYIDHIKTSRKGVVRN